MKSTKKTLGFAILSLVLCVSMLVGTTFAWFTDSVVSRNNIIKSGNLDVELYFTYDAAVAADEDSTAWIKVTDQTDIYGYELWEPGFTKVAYFKVVNEGSLALKYKLSADVFGEESGVNVNGDKFFLSDYIKTALVSTTATRDDIQAMAGVNLKASFNMGAGSLEANDTDVVGLALWMPTTVDNVANHNGTNVPSVTFGINLIATQATSEVDSFGSDYDANALYPAVNFPSVVTANTSVDKTGATDKYEIPLLAPNVNDDGEFAKQGSVIVPKEAIADNAETIEVVIKKLPVADTSVPLAQNEVATTIDITVEGIKEDNDVPIKVYAHIGAGLGDIKLYHKNQQIPFISYDNNTGILIFETTSFSPFTIVNIEDAPAQNIIPKAIVEDITKTYTEYTLLDASSVVGSPSVAEGQKLDRIYKFQAPALIAGNIYNDWACDFYVRYESDKVATLAENTVVLGGQYDAFLEDWIAFSNPTVDAGIDIPLLGSVAQLDWTYEGIANGVGTFLCGVGVTDGKTLNEGKFVVMLRLTNPEKEDDYINVVTVTYDFETGNSTIKHYQ